MELNTFQLISFELLITGIGVFLGLKCLPLTRDNMNYFRRSVIVLNFFLYVNIPIRLSELHIVQFNPTLLYWMYDISIILMNYLMFNWFLFLLKQIDSRFVKTDLRVHLCMIPVVLIIPLCVLNRWTGWLYYIGDDGWYHRGKIFFLQSFVSYAYFFFIILTNIIHLFDAKNKAVVIKCFKSIIPAFISGFLQIFFGGSYLLAGSVICALIMYIEICLDRQKAYEINEQLSSINSELANSNKTIANNMRTILALSDIYHIIIDLDIQNDSFTVIKAPENVSRFCKQFTKATDGLRVLPETMYEGESLKAMKELYNPESFVSRLKNRRSYSADAIEKYSKKWLRNSFVVSETDDDGNPQHIIVTLQDVNLEKEHQKKMEEAAYYQNSAKEMEELFKQTAEALASAIESKDEYTHGHSVRVAEYSRRMAVLAGFSEKECKEVYYAGLLHDVGKIGIPDTIIRKDSKLTDEEFTQIKQHPVTGNEILKSISKLPYLSIGAHYHHERYDGRGYPSGLKGTDIPELARIIAVADAYDAMTSKRSYRDPIPQQKVREEIVKGLGSQFDPKFGKLMLHLIDLDTEYTMKERAADSEVNEKADIICKEYRKNYSEGTLIDPHKVTIKAHCVRNAETDSYPALIIFDSLDARVHVQEREIKDLSFTEYCELFFDGTSSCSNVRKIQTNKTAVSNAEQIPQEFDFTIKAVKIKDHILLKMNDGNLALETTIALPDSTRFAYISLTGKDCTISSITIEREEGLYPPEKIHRIAEEISYIEMSDGDIPNVQIDNWRAVSTKGVKFENSLTLNFHAKSLPFARLVWHCPIIILYSSENGEIGGSGYRELSSVRLDGESWQVDKSVTNKLFVDKTEDFKGWDIWKADNKKGRNITVKISKDDNEINLVTECGGLKIKNTTTLLEGIDNLYVALSGDQCVIENIKLSY